MPNTADRDPDARATARFTPAELAYLLDERRLGRLATADVTGAPHVVPVGWSYNRDLGTIDISGRKLRRYPQVPQRPGQSARGVRRR